MGSLRTSSQDAFAGESAQRYAKDMVLFVRNLGLVLSVKSRVSEQSISGSYRFFFSSSSLLLFKVDLHAFSLVSLRRQRTASHMLQQIEYQSSRPGLDQGQVDDLSDVILIDVSLSTAIWTDPTIG